jgi:ATPase subunit of ABC transporter with duplicated ATPase domains
MPLLQLRQITLKYSSAPLLDQVDFQVDAGERICLLGRNGAGKTSLMRIITGEETPNSGELIIPNEAVVTRLIQDIPDDITGTVMEVLHSGLRADRHEEEWQTDVRLEDLAAEMHLPVDHEFSALSGGLKRRVLLGRALAGQPDILLLDEPTNHLDIDMRHALTVALQSFEGGLLVVSHDRHLIKTVADTLWLVADGKLAVFAGDLDDYQQWLKNRAKAEQVAPEKPRTARRGAPDTLRPLRKELDQIERRLADLAAEQAMVDIAMANAATNLQIIDSKLIEKSTHLRRDSALLEARWMEVGTAIELAEAQTSSGG